MNAKHLALCSSAEWADALGRWIIPWALDGVDLGDDVLEIGPGPGLATDLLRTRTQRLTLGRDRRGAGRRTSSPVGGQQRGRHSSGRHEHRPAGRSLLRRCQPDDAASRSHRRTAETRCSPKSIASSPRVGPSPGPTASTVRTFASCTWTTSASRSSRRTWPPGSPRRATLRCMSTSTSTPSASALARD